MNSGNAIQIPIEKINVHPRYLRPIKYNDIALLKLSRSVTFSSNVRPACLWNRFGINQAAAIATGWGKTDKGFHNLILIMI